MATAPNRNSRRCQRPRLRVHGHSSHEPGRLCRGRHLGTLHPERTCPCCTALCRPGRLGSLAWPAGPFPEHRPPLPKDKSVRVGPSLHTREVWGARPRDRSQGSHGEPGFRRAAGRSHRLLLTSLDHNPRRARAPRRLAPCELRQQRWGPGSRGDGGGPRVRAAGVLPSGVGLGPEGVTLPGAGRPVSPTTQASCTRSPGACPKRSSSG